jgi:mycofactocin biosynthetic radical S-adenosylmethionine protein MftC
MIVSDLTLCQLPDLPPRLRILEENYGGQLFDPRSGRRTFLTDGELVAWQEKAKSDPGLVYYAARQWSSDQLAGGCHASPIRIYLEVTQGCNLSCSMCYREAGKTLDDEMNTVEILGLIGNLSTLGVHELRITGGEPTTRPDLLELVDAAVSAGLYVSLGSNGVWPKGLACKLISRPIGRYLISLEGDRVVNDALRGRGAFDRTLESIDQLVTAGRSVRVNTMLTRITLGHLEETAALCAAHQVRHMALIPPRPAGRAGSESFSVQMPKPYEMELAARLVAQIHHRYGVEIEFEYNVYRQGTEGQPSDPVLSKIVSCPAGREAAFISPAGWLYACGCSPGGSSTASERAPFAASKVRGLDPAGIWQAWQSSYVWQPFRDLSLSKDPACFRCTSYGKGCFGSCPVHAFLSYGAFNAPDPFCWMREEIAT